MSASPGSWIYSLEINYQEDGRSGQTLAGGVGDLSKDDEEVRAVYRAWAGAYAGCKATSVNVIKLCDDSRTEVVRSASWVIDEKLE